MNYLLKHWPHISVYIGAIAALFAALGNFDLREKTILMALCFIMLHFFEEFVFPGGFAWCGQKVELHITDTNPRNWPLNRLNTMFGNWWFALSVYVLALLLPHNRALTLAVVLFAFAEVIMHLLVFNFCLRDWYNPGLFTSIFGLLPVSMNYLIQVWDTHLYTSLDLILALLWIVLNYWIAFRSPIYRKMSKLSHKYAFSDEEVWRAKRYIDRFNS